MPTRNMRRRRRQQLTHLRDQTEGQRRVIGLWHLTRWRREAYRRAGDLGEPAVWALEASARAKALALDPTGELAAELSRACAEAVSRASGCRLVGVSRPLADRARLEDRPRAK